LGVLDMALSAARGRPGGVVRGLARSLLPDVFQRTSHIKASVRGFLKSPLHAAEARDQLLAREQPAFEIEVSGGRLRAHEMWNGNGFALTVYPPPGCNDAILKIDLPPPGHENEVVVQATPHMFLGRLGFHNLSQAKWVLADVGTLLGMGLASADTPRVQALRIEQALERLSVVERRVIELEQAITAHPDLARLEVYAALAYDARPGTPVETEMREHERALEELLQSGRLPPAIAEQVRYDMTFAREQNAFWTNERAAVTNFYVRRLPPPGTLANARGQSEGNNNDANRPA
jgi:hypothetical protein